MLDNDARNKRLLTVDEFGSLYGPRRTHTYKLLASGELKGVKCGKNTYIHRDDAESWARQLPEYRSPIAKS